MNGLKPLFEISRKRMNRIYYGDTHGPETASTVLNDIENIEQHPELFGFIMKNIRKVLPVIDEFYVIEYKYEDACCDVKWWPINRIFLGEKEAYDWAQHPNDLTENEAKYGKFMFQPFKVTRVDVIN